MSKFKLTRADYIKDGYVEHSRVDAIGVAVYFNSAQLTAIGFSGKRQKPDFHCRFGSHSELNKYVADWTTTVQGRVDAKVKNRYEAAKRPLPLVVGDVLRAVTGKDKTEVSYYEVTGFAGDFMVLIRQIACGFDAEAANGNTRQCVPVPGKFIGEPIRRRPDARGALRIQKYIVAYRKTSEEVGGIRCFEPDLCSAKQAENFENEQAD